MSLQPFKDEQLNYFKYAAIVLEEFPKALRQTFRSMWDNTYGHLSGFQAWDDSLAVRNLFLTTEGGTTKVPTNLSYEEWDCTALFQATIYAKSFALPDSKGNRRKLLDLYLSPRKSTRGKFHASVVSPSGNEAETFALAIDQLRLLRNSICHSTNCEIDKTKFDQYVQHAKDAFKALGIKTDPIDVIGSLTESDFPTKEVCKLNQAMKEETRAYIEFLEDARSELATREDIAVMLNQKINDLKEYATHEEPDTKPSLPKSCLPAMVPHFTGREKECEDITGHLTSGSIRIVSIWGSPGFGKTSVAIAVGHHLLSHGLAVHYLSLRGLQSKADLASKLLSLFGRPAASDQQHQQRLSIDDELFQLFSEMSDHSRIILDNADELLSGKPKVKEDCTHFLDEILRRTEKVKFVIATRESLEFMNVQFQGLQTIRISSLDTSSSQNLVRKLLPNVTNSDCKQMTEICGHVPLAIKLLCSFIFEDDGEPNQVLNDFKEALENHNIVEMLDNSDYPSNLTLKFLFNSSFQRLSAQEKKNLVSLSVLPESFDLTVAAFVLHMPQTPAKKILFLLQRKSLLDVSSTPGFFSMHQLIRSFANQTGKHEMKETILTSRTRLCEFYVSRFEKLNEKFLTGDSMSAFIDFYEEEKSITQSLLEGCSDSKIANTVFEVLVKAELFLYSLYWREGSKFNKIYDSALKVARRLNENVFIRQLLVSKALYQVTWGKRGNTKQLLSEAMNIEASCSPVSDDDKGKLLCYSGINQLVNGQTDAGIKSLQEAVSLMSGAAEKSILKYIAFQILAIYRRLKNNSSRASGFFSKLIQGCQSNGTTQLLNTPSMGHIGKKIEENGITQQPLILEIISLVSDATKQLIDTETKRSIIDAAQEITNSIGKSSVQRSLGSFVFQCNANITLQYVMRKEEGSDEISCHETAVNPPKRPLTAPAQQTSTTNKLFSQPSKQSSRLRRPATAGREQSSGLANSYQSFGDTQHDKEDLQSREQALESRPGEFGREQISTAEGYESLGATSVQHAYVQGDFSSNLQVAGRSPHTSLKLPGEHYGTSGADRDHSIGQKLHEIGDFPSALCFKQRALDTRLKLFGQEHSSTADSYHALGDTQHEQGDFCLALLSKQHALDIRRKLFGEQHPSTADSYHSIGATQHAQHDFTSALQSKQRALDIRRKLFGEEHASTAESYHSLRLTQSALGFTSTHEPAPTSAQSVLDITLESFGEHSSTADSRSSLQIIQPDVGSSTSETKQKSCICC